MDSERPTIDDPPQNVIVTSVPVSTDAPARPSPSEAPSGRSVSFTSPEHQMMSTGQPKGPHFLPAQTLPIQRSQSLGSVSTPSSHQGPYAVGGLQHQSGNIVPIHHSLPPPALHPSQNAQIQAPPRQMPSKSRFQTGPSPAAVAYQLSQQMQQYQGGVPLSAVDAYSPTYQHSPAYYDAYGQPYTPYQHDAQGSLPIAPSYSSSYPPPTYPVPAPPPSQQWFPAHPPPPQGVPYYYYPPTGYPQITGQQVPVQHDRMLHASHYQQTAEPLRRHSVPIRSSNTSREFETDGAILPTGFYPQATVTSGNFIGGLATASFGSLPTSQSSSPSIIPRGPPRKPKQSGYALWVGNLPPNTDVGALKDYFSSNLRDQIESVFLISKSNCAFVNYRTQMACDRAMSDFHNSKFRGARLVCRLRPSKVAGTEEGGSTAPTPSIDGEVVPDQVDGGSMIDGSGESSPEKSPPTGPAGAKAARTSARFRYFILKSLTVEDLEMSVKNGIWATQNHNEDVLNEAFDSAESVYLIFSANKSGEYYGYARMASPITGELSSSLTWTPSEQSEVDSELPRAIFTPETETAPKGRIIDDSARGTIFWEALSDSELAIEGERGGTDAEDTAGEKSVSKTWGKPFKVEWLSTARVPFYRTRGLRNNLNSGREVKIARDGTELEESVGRRLLQLFHPRPTAPTISHQSPGLPVVGVPVNGTTISVR